MNLIKPDVAANLHEMKGTGEFAELLHDCAGYYRPRGLEALIDRLKRSSDGEMCRLERHQIFKSWTKLKYLWMYTGNARNGFYKLRKATGYL